MDTLARRLTIKIAVAAATLLLASEAPAASGETDVSYGTQGRVVTSTGEVVALVPRAGGVIAIGRQAASAYFSDGRLDESFAYQHGAIACPDAGLCAWSAAAPHPGGFVLVGATAGGDLCVGHRLGNGMCSGFLDTARIDLGGNDRATAVAVLTDGSILVAGAKDHTVALVRYAPSGKPDESFGVGGTVITEHDNGEPTALAVQSDGKILLSGFFCLDGVGCGWVARHEAGGQPDSSYGPSGIALGTTDNYVFGQRSAACEAPGCPAGGRLVIAGLRSLGDPWAFLVARYLSSGVFDPSFGPTSPFGPGAVVTQVGSSPNDFSAANALVVQADGKVIAGGYTRPHQGHENNFALVRHRPDGSLDGTFGEGGIVIGPLGEVKALALQADGRLIAAGIGSGEAGALVAYRTGECGNGEVDPAEQCDGGSTNGIDGSCCSASCTLRPAAVTCRPQVGACDLAELCDAANSTCPPNAFVPNGQPCSIDGASICDGLGVCIPNGCGDHRTAGGEQCDDGNHVDGDGCDRNCTTTACGNGIVTEGEQCDPPASQGGAPRCKNDCLLSVCGNGIVEAGEACDGGVCCTSGCTFRGPTEPCGTEMRVCHQQPTCNGREATCPSDPKLSDQGSPCLDTTNACVIGACQQATATCELHGRVCDANAKASKNGTRKVKMKVRCAANAESDCEATVFGVPLLPGATAVTAAGTEPEGEQISADLAPAQTRKKAGRGGLRFRTTLHLTLNERGRALLEAGDVRATVHVTIRRGGLTHRSKQLLNLLRFRR